MIKEYIKPEMEITTFSVEDVIRTSGGAAQYKDEDFDPDD